MAASDESLISDSFSCPITSCIMVDPVLCQDGHSYERSSIEQARAVAFLFLLYSPRDAPNMIQFSNLQWFARGNLRSPNTNEPLSSTILVPNHALRNAIAEYRALATNQAALAAHAATERASLV